MREPFVLGGLRVTAILDVQLHRHERNGVVLDDDDLEAVGERGVADGQVGLCKDRRRAGDHEEGQYVTCVQHRRSPGVGSVRPKLSAKTERRKAGGTNRHLPYIWTSPQPVIPQEWISPTCHPARA